MKYKWKDLTQEILKEILEYDPLTGDWVWLIHPNPTTKKGSSAGYINSRGRKKICIKSKTYHSSRLAFLYMTGKWPILEVDHKDTDTTNEKWDNLREATRIQNCGNTNPGLHGSILPKGVKKINNRFIARLMFKGKRTYLGSFETVEEASKIYEQSAKELLGEFVRVSRT